MENSTFITLTQKYFSRFSYGPQQLNIPVRKKTKLIVVIPCYNEAELIRSLASLKACTVPNAICIDVITVVNHSERASEAIKLQNEQTYKAAVKFGEQHSDESLQFLTLKAFDLPKKHAGVGLARKIGMDEALYRFQALNEDGVICCFDADSLCEFNYFEAIYQAFNDNTINGASIHFEHPVEGDEYASNIYKGIIDYELHLRYYKNAIKYTGAPYAFHTIGSSMAVRASAYAKQGGMNKRKAGEDFYFLSKIIQLGNFGEICTTKVIPSPRVSDRVPFGTGKAIGDIIDQQIEDYTTYSFDAFIDLKLFFAQIEMSYHKNNYEQLPTSIQKFISSSKYTNKIEEIKKNTKTLKSYTQRFYFVFDAFWILKFVHFYRDTIQENLLLNDQAIRLLEAFDLPFNKRLNNQELLSIYRKFDC
ncbi:MAG: glycosyltransferase family 2 protein [Flavobacteriales bacterium]|jgi:glycosyltransferase involved in cell wall biosynthesis|nr:glycosyltransferase family 2 protein [Flavobacteriales bacterium]